MCVEVVHPRCVEMSAQRRLANVNGVSQLVSLNRLEPLYEIAVCPHVLAGRQLPAGLNAVG